MNEKAAIAYSQYKDLVTAWGRDINLQAYENGMQLIEWIEDKRTESTVDVRQAVKVTSWECLLSGFPTESLRDEMKRRTLSISSESPICPGCGQYMSVWQSGDWWGCGCECIIGAEISAPYQSTREEVIKAQNEAILAYQANNN